MNKLRRHRLKKMLDDLTPSEAKIYKYLLDHVTPVTSERLCKHFLISQSNVSRSLTKLILLGLVEVSKVGKIKFYRSKPL